MSQDAGVKNKTKVLAALLNKFLFVKCSARSKTSWHKINLFFCQYWRLPWRLKMPRLKCFSWFLFLTEVVLKLRVFVIVFFRSLLRIISGEEGCLWNYFGFNFHAFICTNKNHVCVSCVEKMLNCNLLIVNANISFFCESHDKCHKICLIHCIFIFVHGFIWP